MTVSRILTVTTVALATLAAIGCSSPQPRPYAETPARAAIVGQKAAPPATYMVAEVMPQPQPQPAPIVVVRNDPPVVVASNPPIYETPVMITERAPRADRN